jgi:hypothetical protein
MMTVKELRESLAVYPDDAVVQLDFADEEGETTGWAFRIWACEEVPPCHVVLAATECIMS